MTIPDLDDAVPQILEGWRAHLRAGGSGAARHGARGAAEHGLVLALLRATLAADGDDTHLAGLVGAASTYGSTERIRRLEPAEVCEELSFLRDEVWKLLGDRVAAEPPLTATRLACRLDQAASVVSAAVLSARDACELQRPELCAGAEPEPDAGR